MIILLGWRKSISGFPSGRAEPRWGEQALAAPPVLPFPQLLPARAAGPAHAPGGGSWARSHRDQGQTAPLTPDVLQSRVVVVSWGWMLSAAAQGCSRGSFLGGRRSTQMKVLHLL